MASYLPNQDEYDGLKLELNYRLIKIFIIGFFIVIAIRLLYLQIIQGEEYRKFSNQNLLKSMDVYAPRGKIYDRSGKVLVENLPTYKAIIIPQYADKLERMVHELATALGLKPESILRKVRRSRRQSGPFFPVDIKSHLTLDEIFKVKLIKLDYAGLDVQELILRYYPYSQKMAHTLGYIGKISKKEIQTLVNRHGDSVSFEPKDIIGKRGLERTMDFDLRGKKGQSFVVVDAKGRQRPQLKNRIAGETLKNIAYQPGADVHTTLDIEIQQIATQAFKKFKRVGSLIAMTPKGEILAWVSEPSFDPNLFSKRVSPHIWKKWVSNEDRPLRNKVIQDHYAPGSTFKPIVALAGLQQNLIQAHQQIHAPATYRLGNRVWHDHSQTGHGSINLFEALERSSNVFFYKLGRKLGPDKIAIYAKAFGLGSPTKVPIFGEVKGHIPTRQWKQKRWGEDWQDGESLNTAIGQGHVLVTIIQLAKVYSGIALNGAIYQPRIIKKVVPTPNKTSSMERKPKLIRHLSQDKDSEYFIRNEHFKAVKKGLWQVVNGPMGTAQSIRFKKPFEVAGKTGTAQVKRFSADQIHQPCFQRKKREKHNGWFAGYGSFKGEPKITVAVLTESSCTSAAAVPIAREVFKAYFEKYHGGNRVQ